MCPAKYRPEMTQLQIVTVTAAGCGQRHEKHDRAKLSAINTIRNWKGKTASSSSSLL
jgi:hypothetical protein